jgi:hypothetical protein
MLQVLLPNKSSNTLIRINQNTTHKQLQVIIEKGAWICEELGKGGGVVCVFSHQNPSKHEEKVQVCCVTFCAFSVFVFRDFFVSVALCEPTMHPLIPRALAAGQSCFFLFSF